MIWREEIVEKEITAVIFDMDGVLFDTEKLFLDTYKEVAEEKGMRYIEKAVMGCIGLNIRDTELLFKQEYGEDFPFDEYHTICTERARKKIEEQGLPMKQGVRELLAYLKERGYRIALASSTNRRGVLGHLNRAEITGFFEVIIGGDMVGHGKPEPDIYLRACEELGTNPADTLAIEDSPNGIRSAHAAGVKPVMVPDLIAPTPEIERLLYAKCENLEAVKEMLVKQKQPAVYTAE